MAIPPPQVARLAILASDDLWARVRPHLTGLPVALDRVASPAHLPETIKRQPPDLVVLGETRDAPDVVSLCHQLHLSAYAAPVFLLALVSDAASINACLEAGADEALALPISDSLLHQRLYRMVTMALSRRGAIPEMLLDSAERDQRALAEALRDTAATLNATLELEDVLQRVLDNVDRVVPTDSANFMLIENGIAGIVGSRGYAERGLEQAIHELRFVVDETPNMRVMVEQKTAFVISDTEAFDGWVLTPSTSWIRSHVSAPIVIHGSVVGFLNLDSSIPNRFSPADGERLKAFADQAAVAIHNANLYDALRQQAEELEQRVAERTEELERERAQLQTILDTMNEGVIYDEKLQTRYINRALTDLTGFTIDRWSGFLEPLRPRDLSEADMMGLIASLYRPRPHGGDGYVHEMRLRRADGSEFDASLTCKHVYDGDGKVVGAVTVIRDISHDKALQAQKARFVAYASHELRTPITNLITRLYLLRKKPDHMEEHLLVLEEVAERMRRLVEDMLDRSRFERGVIALQRQVVSMQDLISTVIRTQAAEAEGKGLSLLHEMPREPLLVFADPVRIIQVITNLVINAINYTSPGGSIRVVLACSGNDSGEPSYALVTVEDEGIGIEAEHLPYIFQPFFRVNGHVDGTGLGLSITQQIVQLHGGEIEVESEPGRGSVFRVRLPLSRAGMTTAA